MKDCQMVMIFNITLLKGMMNLNGKSLELVAKELNVICSYLSPMKSVADMLFISLLHDHILSSYNSYI